MNIYPSTKVRPYVYFGYNPATGEFYIGYREANTKPSHIDLFEYRTSSDSVKPMFDQMLWYVLAEFETGNDAYDFEQQSIFENWNDPLLLNESCFYNKRRFKNRGGKPLSSSHKKNISKAKSGIPASQKVCDLLFLTHQTRNYTPLSDDTKLAIRNSKLGCLSSEETKALLKEKRKQYLETHQRLYEIITPTGEKFQMRRIEFMKYCIDHCLNYGSIVSYIRKKKPYKGYTIISR